MVNSSIRLGSGARLKLLLSRRRFKRFLPSWTNTIRIEGIPHPFHFRHGTTDKYVVMEVLGKAQYRCTLGGDQVRTIVDAGANIGTASVFFLNAYPEARVFSLEPDIGNFDVLKRNLSYYPERAFPMYNALWPTAESLTVRRGAFRDGGNWSFQVQPTSPEAEAEIQGITIPGLIQRHSLDTIDILKIDIEGAERHVFKGGLHWLQHVRTIAIELHDAECRERFEAAISVFKGDVTQHGEVTLWRQHSNEWEPLHSTQAIASDH